MKGQNEGILSEADGKETSKTLFGNSLRLSEQRS